MAGSGPSRRAEVVAGLAVAAVVLALPLVVTDTYSLKVLTFIAINVIVVIGLAMLFGYAGQISLGQAAFVGLGAYTSAVLTTQHGWPWLAAVVAAVAVAAATGFLLSLPALRLTGHYLAMATLGFGEIVVVLLRELDSITGGSSGLTGIGYPSVAGVQVQSAAANYLLVAGFAVAAYALAANMLRLRPGRALRAIHGTEAGARACGIDVPRVKRQVFTVSAALAGLGGALYAHFVGFISPTDFGLGLSIMLVAMVALGGSGSLPGAVVGAVVLTVLQYPDVVSSDLPRAALDFIRDWRLDVYGLTLILVMLFAPQGLAGVGRWIFRGVTGLLSRGPRSERPSEEREIA